MMDGTSMGDQYRKPSVLHVLFHCGVCPAWLGLIPARVAIFSSVSLPTRAPLTTQVPVKHTFIPASSFTWPVGARCGMKAGWAQGERRCDLFTQSAGFLG